MKAAEKLLAGPDLVVDGLARASAAISLVEASESNELEDSERGELQGILKTFTLPVVFYAPQPGTQPLAIEEMQQLFHDFIHDCEKTLDPDMLNAAKPHLEERLTTFRDELKAHQLGREGTARPDGELARVFPKAEALIQKMQLDVRYKDVTFETLNREDFLDAVKEVFPRIDWDKAYKEFMGDECGSRCPCIPDRRPAGLNACIVKVRKQIDETVLFFCGLWRISRCNNLAALTRQAPNISVRLHRVQVLGTSCNGRPRFGRCRRGRCRVPSSSSRSRSRRHRCPSSIPRQLTFPPMVGLAIRIELVNVMPVQCPHRADSGEHCRAAKIGYQHQRLNCGRPCRLCGFFFR